MPGWLIWAALGAGILAVLGALAYLAVRLLQGWRDFKRVRRRVVKALETFTEKAELAAEKAEAAADTEELQERLGRLRRSLAQLAVLRAAVDEARSLFRFA